jgi:alkaline phosphatase
LSRGTRYLLGDGMGVSEITAARYYEYGAGGRMNVDRLPFTGFDASIDKQDHAASACGQIGETIAFDDAIGVAMEYQATIPTRSWWSRRTTRTPARSWPRTPRARATRRATRTT